MRTETTDIFLSKSHYYLTYRIKCDKETEIKEKLKQIAIEKNRLKILSPNTMAVPQLSKKAIVEQAQPKKNEHLVNKIDVDIPKAQSSCADDKSVTASVNCVDECLNGIKQTKDEPIKPEIATVVEMETNPAKAEIHVVWKFFAFEFICFSTICI